MSLAQLSLGVLSSVSLGIRKYSLYISDGHSFVTSISDQAQQWRTLCFLLRDIFTKAFSTILVGLCVLAKNRDSFRTSRERWWDGEGGHCKTRWRFDLKRGAPGIPKRWSPESGAHKAVECGKKILAPLLRCIYVLNFYRKIEQTYLRYTSMDMCRL